MQPTKRMPDGVVVHSVLPPPVLKEVEALRGARSPIPPRAAVLLELVQLGLAAIKSRRESKRQQRDAALPERTPSRRRAGQKQTTSTDAAEATST
jgi:hypothetical protein